MSKSSPQHGILVGVDGSPASDAAVRWAADEAVMRGLPVTLMHVVTPVVVTWPIRYLASSYAAWQEDNAKHVVEQAQKTLQDVKTEVRHGGCVAELVEASKQAMMIVIGSRGLGEVSGSVFGSVSRGLLHYARSPVAVIRAEQPTADAKSPVLLGIDGSRFSESATALAFDEASRRGTDLVALHAWSDIGAFLPDAVNWQEHEQEGHEVLAERLAGWTEQYPEVAVRRRIVCDRPAHWLIEESAGSALVVVGSRGRGGFAGMLLGSVSTEVAEASRAPVIVVRS